MSVYQTPATNQADFPRYGEIEHRRAMGKLLSDVKAHPVAQDVPANTPCPKPCPLCGTPTTGVKGYIIPLCPPCRESEQAALEARIKLQAAILPPLMDLYAHDRDHDSIVNDTPRYGLPEAGQYGYGRGGR